MPLAPIVVLVTVSATPVVDASVFTIELLFCVALIVPPPVAENALPVEVVTVRLLKFSVPRFAVMFTPLPVLPLSVTTMSWILLVPDPAALPSIADPDVFVIEKYSTTLPPASVITLPALLSAPASCSH